MDINDWIPLEKFDVLLSFDAFEHIDNPRYLLEKMADFLAPDGIAIIAFEPLFHSPFGDHMSGFFRIQIPWRGILFSEKAILRVRKKYYRPTDAAEHYKEIIGGLNLIRYSEFLRYVKETGWNFSFLELNSSLKRIPPLRYISNVVTRTPIIRDFFVYSISCILDRSPHFREHG
jgi:SAM-dependent methyltransferase